MLGRGGHQEWPIVLGSSEVVADEYMAAGAHNVKDLAVQGRCVAYVAKFVDCLECHDGVEVVRDRRGPLGLAEVDDNKSCGRRYRLRRWEARSCIGSEFSRR
jgi:hypothetical protein